MITTRRFESKVTKIRACAKKIYLLFYSCTSPDPIPRLTELFNEFTTNIDPKDGAQSIKFLIGCRKDMIAKENITLSAQIDKFAKSRCLNHFVTSSKMNSNVDAVS